MQTVTGIDLMGGNGTRNASADRLGATQRAVRVAGDRLVVPVVEAGGVDARREIPGRDAPGDQRAVNQAAATLAGEHSFAQGGEVPAFFGFR